MKAMRPLHISLGFVTVGLIVGLAAYVYLGPERLLVRTDKGFRSLALPRSFEMSSKKKSKWRGDLITSSRAAQVRTYKVASSMQSTKNTLLERLQHQKEDTFEEFDRRLSMHPGQLGLENLGNSCSPGQVALNSGTFATIVVHDAPIDVQLDEDGKMVNAYQYKREACQSDVRDTHVAIIIWAM